MKREFRHNGVKWEMTEQLEFQTLINSDPELNYTVSRDALLRLNIINVIIFNLLGGKWMPFVVSVLLMWRLKNFFYVNTIHNWNIIHHHVSNFQRKLYVCNKIIEYNNLVLSHFYAKRYKKCERGKVLWNKIEKKNGSTKNIQLSRNKTL